MVHVDEVSEPGKNMQYNIYSYHKPQKHASELFTIKINFKKLSDTRSPK